MLSHPFVKGNLAALEKYLKFNYPNGVTICYSKKQAYCLLGNILNNISVSDCTSRLLLICTAIP